MIPHNGLSVQLPNNAIIKSTSIGKLTLPTITVPAYIFPDSVLSHTLLSIPTLVNKGCVAVFTQSDVTVTNNDTMFGYSSSWFSS